MLPGGWPAHPWAWAVLGWVGEQLRQPWAEADGGSWARWAGCCRTVCAPWAGGRGWRALDLAHSQAQSAWLATFWFAMLGSFGSSPVSFKGSECAFLGATEQAREAVLQSALWLSAPGLGPHSKLPLAATVFSPCGLGLAPLELVTCLWTAPLGPPTCSTSHTLFSICPLKAPPSPSSPREGWGWHSSPLWGAAGWDPRALPGTHGMSSAVAPAQKRLLAPCASGTAPLPSESDPRPGLCRVVRTGSVREMDRDVGPGDPAGQD